MEDMEIGTDVVPVESGAVAPAGSMDVEKLMALAIEKDGAIDVIERLVELREKEMARLAEQQMGEAIAEFKRRCPRIPRNKRGSGFRTSSGTQEYVWYAPLEGIQFIVDPILHDLGLSYSWNSTASSDSVVTTCVLRHVSGAERKSSMALPVSGPPKSSSTQAHAGTRTFNKRLTLSDVLGITTCDDADGQDGDSGETIDDEQLAEIRALVQRKNVNIDRFLEFVGVESLRDITVATYGMAMRTLEAKADK